MLLLANLAFASPPPCATPEALDALRGHAPATHAHMVAAPVNLDGRARPSADGKTMYGGNYEFHVDTANFTVNWWDASIDPEAAQSAAEALEGAWTALVEEQGWTPPVSSDRYLIWVLLDPSLSATGYTTEYRTDAYPDGYPVVYLNPAWATDTAFWGSLAAHEFMHALQFALREWDGSSDNESWYWEASATWASELTAPERDGYQYASAWYAEQTDRRYDATEGYHHYGMFVFNAWLEQQGTGPGTLKSVWERGATDRSDWAALLTDTTGLGADALWGGFTGAYGNERLAESDQYTRVDFVGPVEDGATGTLPLLGTHYYRVPDAARVTATGDVVLAGPDGHGSEIDLDAGDRLAVTALSEGDYTLRVSDPPAPDTGDAATDDSNDGSTADSAGPDDAGASSTGGCACTSTESRTGAVWPAALLGALTLLRRRRPARGA
jgi:MYXO-CTERM domain-containing protein